MTQSGYTDFISQSMKDLSNPQAMTWAQDQIFKHNYNNNELVQHVPTSKMKLVENINPEFAFALLKDDVNDLIIGRNADGNVEYKKFLKRNVTITNERDEVVDTKVQLFQLAGYTEYEAIYVRTNKLGYSKGGLNIKEYGNGSNHSIFAENNVTLPTEVEELLGDNLIYPEPVVATYQVISKKVKSDEEQNDDFKICKNRE